MTTQGAPASGSSGAAHRLAIYDLDRTITRHPTWTPFLLQAARTTTPWRLSLVPVAAGAALVHKLGLIDRRSLKQIMHQLMIGVRPASDMAALGARFAASFARHIAPGARAAIAADRAAGRRVVIATAAHRFYAAPIAASLGIDDLVATAAAADEAGNVLPVIEDANCYGAEKLAMIERWMAAEGIARSDAHVRFYSDHRSDVPTLDWADEPFAVNPHAALRRVAERRGWPVLDWR